MRGFVSEVALGDSKRLRFLRSGSFSLLCTLWKKQRFVYIFGFTSIYEVIRADFTSTVQ